MCNNPAAVFLSYIPITLELIRAGCAVSIELSDGQLMYDKLHRSQNEIVDLSGQFPVSNLSFGFTTEEPGYFGRKYVSYVNELSKNSGKPAVVADIGVAWRGVNSLPVLEKGNIVYAVDTEEKDLRGLAYQAKMRADHSTNEDFQKHWMDNLKLYHGALPDHVDLPQGQFDAVIVASVLHFLEAHEVDAALKRIYKMLKPGGKVFIEAQTPYMNGLNNWRRTRIMNVRRDRRLAAMRNNRYQFSPSWPWQIDNREGKFPFLGEVKYLNLFDLPHLTSSMRRAGFNVASDEAGYFARGSFPEMKSFHFESDELREQYTNQVSRRTRFESVGAIGTKPLEAQR